MNKFLKGILIGLSASVLLVAAVAMAGIGGSGINIVSPQWGNIQGVISNQPDLVNYVATHGEPATQTPWGSNINGGGHNLSNVGSISVGSLTATTTASLGNVFVGSSNQI